MMAKVIDIIQQLIENHETRGEDVARELLPALAAELIVWTLLREGVNPSQSEIAPICELGPALGNLQGLLDASFRAPFF